MQAFKDGDIRFLICTDVAARGIDIAGLPYVVNMTLPDRSEDYIHRVGRVGKFSSRESTELQASCSMLTVHHCNNVHSATASHLSSG